MKNDYRTGRLIAWVPAARVALAVGACVWLTTLSIDQAVAQTYRVAVSESGISPTVMTGTQGTALNLTVVNVGKKQHNFVIPDFYIFTNNLAPGEQVTVAFTPDKTGRFPYYSDTGGKPEPGIAGHLRVRTP